MNVATKARTRDTRGSRQGSRHGGPSSIRQYLTQGAKSSRRCSMVAESSRQRSVQVFREGFMLDGHDAFVWPAVGRQMCRRPDPIGTGSIRRRRVTCTFQLGRAHSVSMHKYLCIRPTMEVSIGLLFIGRPPDGADSPHSAFSPKTERVPINESVHTANTSMQT